MLTADLARFVAKPRRVCPLCDVCQDARWSKHSIGRSLSTASRRRSPSITARNLRPEWSISGRYHRCAARFHLAREGRRKQLRRVLQRAARWMPERESVLVDRRCKQQDLGVADGLQPSQTAQLARGQGPGGALGRGNSGGDCAAFFREINRPKMGPGSPTGGVYSQAVLFSRSADDAVGNLCVLCADTR
jgi:hypothetical protein